MRSASRASWSQPCSITSFAGSLASSARVLLPRQGEDRAAGDVPSGALRRAMARSVREMPGILDVLLQHRQALPRKLRQGRSRRIDHRDLTGWAVRDVSCSARVGRSAPYLPQLRSVSRNSLTARARSGRATRCAWVSNCTAAAPAEGGSSPAGRTIADPASPGSHTTRLPGPDAASDSGASSTADTSNDTPAACACSASASRDVSVASSPAGTCGQRVAMRSAIRRASEDSSSGWRASATAFGVMNHPRRTQPTGHAVVSTG